MAIDKTFAQEILDSNSPEQSQNSIDSVQKLRDEDEEKHDCEKRAGWNCDNPGNKYPCDDSEVNSIDAAREPRGDWAGAGVGSQASACDGSKLQ